MRVQLRWLALLIACLGVLSSACGTTEGTQEDGVVQTDGSTQDSGSVDKDNCKPGSLVCRCDNGKCDKGLRCEADMCVTCTPGSPGCPCRSDNSCEFGNTCEKGVCKGCIGKEKCPCYGNGNCDLGLKCEQTDSHVRTCQKCDKDKNGCNCKTDKECGDLSCINQRCQKEDKNLQPPKNPKCYTPCSGDISVDKKLIVCHAKYKLREGCEPGQVCKEGSCVSSDLSEGQSASQYPFCKSAADCPSWQTCLQGKCYSTCTSSASCGEGNECYRYVCRKKCDDKKSTCGKEEACELTGEQSGYCMPKSPLKFSNQPQTKTPGNFELPLQHFTLNTFKTFDDLIIENNAIQPTTFKITALSDTTGKSGTPLTWLKFALCKTYTKERNSCSKFDTAKSATNGVFSLESVPSKTRIIIRISNAAGKPQDIKKYSGQLKVEGQQLGSQQIGLEYQQSSSGQWQGKMVFFGNFEDNNIDKFPSKAPLNIDQIKNALMRRWDEFKHQKLAPAVSFDSSFQSFRAMLSSLREGSWSFEKTQKDCKDKLAQGSTDVVCYPSAASKGYSLLTLSKKEAPVPSGVSEMDFTINVKEVKSQSLEGRIDSRLTLHYPGNPEVKLTLASSPEKSKLAFLNTFDATILLGGRYPVSKIGNCHDTTEFIKKSYPWLAPDFMESSYESASKRLQSECRMQNFPQKPTGTSEEQEAMKQSNINLSMANPIPNGRTIRRRLELVDGAIIENRYMFIIFKERLTSFFAGSSNNALNKEFVNYGYMMLQRTGADLEDKDYTGAKAPVENNKTCTSNSQCGNDECVSGKCMPKSRMNLVQCTPELIKLATNKTISKPSDLERWNKTALEELVDVLTNGPDVQKLGTAPIKTGSYTKSGKKRYIHYLCEDTKQFNGGPKGDVDCPNGSKVRFFDSLKTESQIRAESCQSNATCHETYDKWTKSKPDSGFRFDLPYVCADKNAVLCDTNLKNLREGKVFFQPTASTGKYIAPFSSLSIATANGFRYRVKFQSRSGGAIGFVPTVCKPYTDTLTPYCYDPKEIEKITSRVNCLQSIYNNSKTYQNLSTTTRAQLNTFLRVNFSFQSSGSTTLFGFDYMNAELKIMMADEAYIQALTSRFDLAALKVKAFKGSDFEFKGVDLSGPLGASMHNLYLSTQYYQMVLDRFFLLSPSFAQAFTSNNFIDVNVVSTYFKKVLQASSRKARSWGAIAKEYHALNEPALAQMVVERAYATTYMEFTIFTRLMKLLLSNANFTERAQISKEIEEAALVYRAAMNDMEAIYKNVKQQLNFFGFPRGYIPFPALSNFAPGAGTTNAFSVSLQYAKEKLALAVVKEKEALNGKRAFDTDSASFQNELQRIEQNYGAQLEEVCGTIKGSNGKNVPAIAKNAHLDPKAKLYGNPCGRMGSGSLYNAYIGLEKFKLAADAVKKNHELVQKQIKDEKDRIEKYCLKRADMADLIYSHMETKAERQQAINDAQVAIDSAQRTSQNAFNALSLFKCGLWNCPSAAFAGGTFLATAGISEGVTIPLSLEINSIKSDIAKSEREHEKEKLMMECDKVEDGKTEGTARLESRAKIIQFRNRMQTFHLESLQVRYDVMLALANIKSLEDRAARLINLQEQTTQQVLNVQAAKNDPNIRIYQNDAIIAADNTFNLALRAAYEATVVYEYYTGSSYKDKVKLFLIRMATAGDYTLESYIANLEEAFRAFERNNGKPDTRLMIVSLQNDILKIPQVSSSGKALTTIEREYLFQKEFTDKKRLSSEGYITFPFAISVLKGDARVSPVTMNHKILYIEAEIKGTELGDKVGRIYLQQKGTGMVRTAKDEIKYYTLPRRTAVINPFFNATKGDVDRDIYKNFRLRDRPLGNTHWELIFNQLTEKENQDIDINAITDIKLYIYYTDFTEE